MNNLSELIMPHEAIVRKLDRMAREILEVHFEESTLILLGIEGQGVALCQALVRRLQSLSDIDVAQGVVSLNKTNPLAKDVVCDVSKDAMNDRIVILVDDVLNSGQTLIHAVREVLLGNPREVHTAVLVDRKHRAFPIRADYCGLTLSTHLNEHIAVDLSDEDNATVHLERQ